MKKKNTNPNPITGYNMPSQFKSDIPFGSKKYIELMIKTKKWKR